jgi:hypothetical protein
VFDLLHQGFKLRHQFLAHTFEEDEGILREHFEFEYQPH